MYILGLPGIHHPSWALSKDGQIIVTIEEDRLHRHKDRFGIVNTQGQVDVLRGWDYCLNAAGISPQDIDYLAFGFNPSSINQPDQMNYRQEKYHHERVFVQQHLLLNHIRRYKDCKSPVYYLRHHLAHAAAVYFLSPFDESVVVIADGWGEDETVSVFKAEGANIRHLASITLPNSLGEVYTKLTTILGWGKDDAGKTMGLAAFGSHDTNADKLILHGEAAEDTLWLDTSRAFDLLNALPLRHQAESLEQWHADLAGRLQHEIEEAMLYVCEWAYHKTGSNNLCLGGGVALNSVCNYRILTETDFGKIFIQPACGDSGLPVGSCLGLYFHFNPNGKRVELNSPFLGISYPEARIQSAIGELHFSNLQDPEQLLRATAEMLSEQKIVAWFQGGSEYGPRALGHRSILADPRRGEMKDILNLKVKHREPFRPFAPSVLQENSREYFELDVPSPFMLLVSPIKPSKLSEIPAVAHVDATARLHTVEPTKDKLLYELISHFADKTGTPVLLNTSFNIAGEPIVETPEDAVQCFLKTDIDVLVMGSFLISKQKLQTS